MGCIRGGRKGSDMTEELTLSLSPSGQDTVKVGKGLFLSVGLGLPRLLSELARESRWRLMEVRGGGPDGFSSCWSEESKRLQEGQRNLPADA